MNVARIPFASMLKWREGSFSILAQTILLSLLDTYQSLACMKIPHYLLLDIGSHLLVSPCEVIHVLTVLQKIP